MARIIDRDPRAGRRIAEKIKDGREGLPGRRAPLVSIRAKGSRCSTALFRKIRKIGADRGGAPIVTTVIYTRMAGN